jgi:hypothetical protein
VRVMHKKAIKQQPSLCSLLQYGKQGNPGVGCLGSVLTEQGACTGSR